MVEFVKDEAEYSSNGCNDDAGGLACKVANEWFIVVV